MCGTINKELSSKINNEIISKASHLIDMNNPIIGDEHVGLLNCEDSLDTVVRELELSIYVCANMELYLAWGVAATGQNNPFNSVTRAIRWRGFVLV